MKWTPIVAIVGIIILECLALVKGVNGTGLSLAIGSVCAFGGYGTKALRDRIRGGKQ